jgi:integrase
MLTVRTIEAAKPRAQRYEIPDGHGLYLAVMPSGAKSWALRYRFDGRTRRHVLGPWPVLSLAHARQAAGEALRSVRQGADPGAVKRVAAQQDARRRANSFEQVAADFKARYLIGPDPDKPLRRSAEDIAKAIERDLTSVWHGKAISDITRRDVVVQLEKLADRSPSVARHALAFGRKLLRWAIGRAAYGIEHSPFEGLSATEVVGPVVRRDRVLTNVELRLFWRATGDADQSACALARLLLLTGARLRQVAGMVRSELDADGIWTIPSRRSKNKQAIMLPLSPLALDLIAGLPEPKDGDYLLTTTDGQAPLGDFNKMIERLRAAMVRLRRDDLDVPVDDDDLRKHLKLAPKDRIPDVYLIPRWTYHDLRRTARSHWSGLPIDERTREMMLGHVSPELIRVYDQHAYLDEKRRGFELWERRLLEIFTPPPSKAKLAVVR